MSPSPDTAVFPTNFSGHIPHRIGRTDDSFCRRLSREGKWVDVGHEVGTGDPTSERYQPLPADWALESTTSGEHLDSARRTLRLLLDYSAGSVFEDGMDNPFSREFVLFIHAYGTLGVSLFGEIAVSQPVNEEAVSEASRWLGRIRSTRTKWARLQLLIHLLGSKSPKVRDGALLGLASMDSPEAVRPLGKAIAEESIEDLRSDMKLVLQQLERVR